MNSCRTVDSLPIVSGERPSDFQPSHFGVKSTQGISEPFITSGAILKLVVMVQKIGNRQIAAQMSSIP